MAREGRRTVGGSCATACSASQKASRGSPSASAAPDMARCVPMSLGADGDRCFAVLQHLQILAFPQRRLEPRLAGQFAEGSRQPAEEGGPLALELAQRLPVAKVGRVEAAAAEQKVPARSRRFRPRPPPRWRARTGGPPHGAGRAWSGRGPGRLQTRRGAVVAPLARRGGFVPFGTPLGERPAVPAVRRHSAPLLERCSRALSSSVGVWWRASGALASIFRMTAHRPAGTSGLMRRMSVGSVFRCL